METQIPISPCQNIPNLPKKSSKRNQNPSTYYNSITTDLKFQHERKMSSFKNPHIKKVDLLLLLLPSRGQNPLSYTIYSIMNLNTISLPSLVGKANKPMLKTPYHCMARVKQHSYECTSLDGW
jgi:hypothetical protein